MKKNIQVLVCSGLLSILFTLIEIDNYKSGVHRIKTSIIFHLPVRFILQEGMFLASMAIALFVLIFFIKYMKKNWNSTPKIQEYEDARGTLTYLDYKKSDSYSIIRF